MSEINPRREIADSIHRSIIRMVYDNPYSVLALRSRYITEDLWKMAIELEPNIYKYIKEPGKAVTKHALRCDGMNLQYVLNPTYEYAYIAVSSNPNAIFYVPEALLTDGIKELAFDGDPEIMSSFNDVREEYIKKKIQEHPSIVRYLKHPSEDIICEALKIDPDIALYYDRLTDKMCQVLDEYYPQECNTYPNYRDDYYITRKINGETDGEQWIE